jgi:anti-anti-sigma factor
MARVLIVGCGCRGQSLARELRAAGHAVRGTTRDPERTAAIAACGAEPYVGDPDRIATLMEALTGVTVLCWLMGSATGDPERVAALHDGRLRMLWEKLVDTPVRGVVHEAAGTLPAAVLAQGRAVARTAHETWRIPLELLEIAPADHSAWLAAGRSGVERLLGTEPSRLASGAPSARTHAVQPDDLAFTVETEDGVVRPKGELDLGTADRVRDALREQAASAAHVTLDLAGLSFLDTSGLRLILETVEESRRDGFTFSVRPGPPEIQRLFELAGVTQLVPFDGADAGER